MATPAMNESHRGWDKLPYNLMINVFLMLEEKDMVNASSACSSWRKLYHEPRFWRSVTFDLNLMSQTLEQVPKKLQTHILTIGSSVEHLTIICPEDRLFVPSCVTESVKIILDKLVSINKTVKTFQLKEIRMIDNWSGFDCCKCELIHSLCHFIKSQTCLQTLVISEALLPTTYGHMVMSSLARSPSVDTLQHLNIVYLYAFDLSCNKQHGELIRAELKKFQNLKEVALDCRLLNAIEVEKLCESMAHSLKLLKVMYDRLYWKFNRQFFQKDNNDNDDDDDYSYAASPNSDFSEGTEGETMTDPQYILCEDRVPPRLFPPMSSANWSEASRVCPGLRVSVEFEEIWKEFNKHVIATIPMSQLTIKNVSCYTYSGNRNGVNYLLNHLSACCFKNLESAAFIGNENDYTPLRDVETGKDEVINFLVKYPNIKSLQFTRNLMSHMLLQSITAELSERYQIVREILSII